MTSPQSGISRLDAVLVDGATLTTFHGSQDGPTLALLGGVHGDEDEGILAVRRVLHEVVEAPLAGTLRAVAPANPSAWAAHRRTSPLDEGNLARSFPGDSDGGPTVALAAAISEGVLEGADVLIDLHSAGLRYAMPLFCGFIREGEAAADAERAAVAFGAPLIWAHNRVAPGRSLSVAVARGIPAVYAECSGGGSIRSGELDSYIRGVLAVMATFGMLPETFDLQERPDIRWVHGAGDLDEGVQSAHEGYFVCSISAGELLAEGAEIGRVYDYRGQLLDVVVAPQEGMVMFLRRQARVQAGDVLFALARLGRSGVANDG